MQLGEDMDGDLILERRKRSKMTCCQHDNRGDETEASQCIRIKHHLGTKLSDVGLQVWNGAILLSEFLLQHERLMKAGAGVDEDEDDFLLLSRRSERKREGMGMLELGCGTGLPGICAAANGLAPFVFLTDRTGDILEQCEENAAMNQRTRNQTSPSSSASIKKPGARCRILDWSKPVKEQLFCGDREVHGKYGWDAKEDLKLLKQVKILLAADCIYDDVMTDNLFLTLSQLVPYLHPSGCTLFLTCEKRYNFTLKDTWEARASAFEHLIDNLKFYSTKSLAVKYRMIPTKAIAPLVLGHERTTDDLVLLRVELKTPDVP